MKPLEELAKPHLRDLEPYTPGLQPSGDHWIKLNTNESPFPPPAAVEEAIMNEVQRLARYPNPGSEALREALADLHGVSPRQVIIGNGSDDLLNLLVRAFGGEGRLTLQTFPSYSLYPVITAIAGGTIQSVFLDEDFSLPVDALVSAGADLLFLTCPNAPTGVRFAKEALCELARRHAGILVIDEAYVEFAEESALSLLQDFDHVVLTRTFSKAYGLAGLRVGYALAHPEVIGILDRIRDSYNVNRLSQAGALAALRQRDVYDARIREIRETRDWLRGQLAALGWKVLPSEANFLFAAPVDADGSSSPELAAGLYEWLLERKILVRTFPKHPLTAAHLRISIGSNSQMERFLEEVRKWQNNV